MAGEAQIEAALAAVIVRLEADATITTLAPGGVWHTRAPQGRDAPTETYVTVRRRPGGRIVDAISMPLVARTVMVEVVATVPGAGTTEAARLDERFDALLADHRLTLPAPWSCIGCRRAVDVDLSSVDDGIEFDRAGGLYRIWLTGSAP